MNPDLSQHLFLSRLNIFLEIAKLQWRICFHVRQINCTIKNSGINEDMQQILLCTHTFRINVELTGHKKVYFGGNDEKTIYSFKIVVENTVIYDSIFKY